MTTCTVIQCLDKPYAVPHHLFILTTLKLFFLQAEEYRPANPAFIITEMVKLKEQSFWKTIQLAGDAKLAPSQWESVLADSLHQYGLYYAQQQTLLRTNVSSIFSEDRELECLSHHGCQLAQKPSETLCSINKSIHLSMKSRLSTLIRIMLMYTAEMAER